MAGTRVRTVLLAAGVWWLALACQELNPAFDEESAGGGGNGSDGDGSTGGDGGTSGDGITLPGCEGAPELPNVVGPYQEMSIGNARLNGARQSWIEVAPGATVELGFDYEAAACSCPTCSVQGVVGLLDQVWRDCFYLGTPGCEGVTDTAVLTFTAPTDPGDYLLSFDRGLEASCTPENAVLKPDQAFAGICVAD